MRAPAATGSNPPAWLAGVSHYRVLPAVFPGGMKYHFDGLATALKLTMAEDNANAVEFVSKAYASDAAKDFARCLFFGTGFGPTLGTQICFTNPGVNLLPIEGQMWLTIDTSSWGRVDPATLETVAGAKVDVGSLVLNAHPACDRRTNECFVQHPCPRSTSPLSDQVCFSLLIPQHDAPNANMATRELARVSLSESEIIQHSHSPCITENWVVSKVDSFEMRNPLLNANGGLLRFLNQREGGVWLAMNRRTNATRVLRSKEKFVENHIWNCYESVDGDVLAEAVATTSSYLDTYFERSLDANIDWSLIFRPALRCVLPLSDEGDDEVSCTHMLKGGQGEDMVWDYPTFNPVYKMRDYQWVFAIAVGDKNTSRWFDKAVKIDRHAGSVAQSWSEPGIYLTEFDFVPRGQEVGDELDGVLLTILYNSTSDESSFAVFCPRKMEPLALYHMKSVVPFHAHGISCLVDGTCFTNP